MRQEAAGLVLFLVPLLVTLVFVVLRLFGSLRGLGVRLRTSPAFDSRRRWILPRGLFRLRFHGLSGLSGLSGLTGRLRGALPFLFLTACVGLLLLLLRLLLLFLLLLLETLTLGILLLLLIEALALRVLTSRVVLLLLLLLLLLDSP